MFANIFKIFVKESFGPGDLLNIQFRQFNPNIFNSEGWEVF